MVAHPEKCGVAITHAQLKSLLVAQDERDELVEKMIEDEMVREDDAGYLSWVDSGELVAPGFDGVIKDWKRMATPRRVASAFFDDYDD